MKTITEEEISKLAEEKYPYCAGTSNAGMRYNSNMDCKREGFIKGYKANTLNQITGETSDGYHTFNELYEFRKVFNAALFNEWQVQGKYDVHKSYKHNDGELCFGGGWFIVVAVLPTGQISNHYENKDWELFKIDAVNEALFPFDDHTPKDVLERLKNVSSTALNNVVEVKSAEEILNKCHPSGFTFERTKKVMIEAMEEYHSQFNVPIENNSGTILSGHSEMAQGITTNKVEVPIENKNEDNVRECVKWFAKEMEKKLKENDHKPGWQEDCFEALYLRMKHEVREVAEAFDKNNRAVIIIRECADVANFAMMIADNYKKHLPQ